MNKHESKGKAPKADPTFAKLLRDADTMKSFTRHSGSDLSVDVTINPALHGMVGNGAITEPCPNCLYAYADGGYCSDCGWSKPIFRDEYDTNRGVKYE